LELEATVGVRGVDGHGWRRPAAARRLCWGTGDCGGRAAVQQARGGQRGAAADGRPRGQRAEAMPGNGGQRAKAVPRGAAAGGRAAVQHSGAGAACGAQRGVAERRMAGVQRKSERWWLGNFTAACAGLHGLNGMG